MDLVTILPTHFILYILWSRKVDGEKALVMTDPVLEGCTVNICDYVVNINYELLLWWFFLTMAKMET